MNLRYQAVSYSLYRSYLRQIRRLPHIYLRQFFRIKAADDIRAILRTTTTEDLQDQKIKRVSKDLRRIEAANNGNSKAFAHILDLAYGRKGKLRWEIMRPLLSDPNAPIPPRIIPTEVKSRPPVYPQELKALLTSGHARTTKALSIKSLDSPPILPARAKPTSEEARLLGPFSKRREVNIRWRYFVTEWKKVRPPLQVVVSRSLNEVVHEGVTEGDILRAGIRGLGMQGLGVCEEIEKLVGPPWMPRTPTRRKRLAAMNILSEPSTSIQPWVSSRWLRRRYQELLGRLPILTYSPSNRPKDSGTGGSYSVSLSRRAILPSQRFQPSRMAEVDPADLAWLEHAEKETEGYSNAKKYNK